MTKFLPGDLRLEQRTYTAQTYNLASHGRWDDANNVSLTTTYDYDSYGNRRSETAPGGFVTRYDYDPDYHAFPVSVTSPPDDRGVSLVTSHGYDPRFGVEVARRQPDGSVFVRGLDGLGRRTVEQGPIPDRPGAVGDPNALTPLVTGSPELRQLFLNAPTVTLETAAYLDDGQGGHYAEFRSLQSFPDGPAREFLSRRSYVDGRGLPRETFQLGDQDDRNTVTLADYDGDGHPLLQSLPFFSPTAIVAAAPHAISTRYDVLGRRLERREPAGLDGSGFSAVTWTYGRNGQVTVTQAAGSDVAYTQVQEHHLYDSKSKVCRTVVPTDGNATTLFQFDRLGRLVEATDPATPSNPQGVTNTTTYDSLDRRLMIDNPDQNTTGDLNIKAARFDYDPVTGRLAKQTDASQQAVSYSYDAMGRITRQVLPDSSFITRIYDEGTAGLGRLTRVSLQDVAGTVQSQYVLGYDRYGNIADTVLSIEGESAPFETKSTFDPQRRVVREQLPDGNTIARQYASGRLTGLSLGQVAVAYPPDHYHPTGKPGRLVYGSGKVDGGCVVADRSFNPAGLLYRETLANGTGAILDDSYEYDLLSQILRIGTAPSGGPSQAFTYSNRRLVAATVPGFADSAYAYDASGNLVAKDKVRYACRAHFAVSGTAGGAEVYSARADACGRTSTRTVNGVGQSFEYDGLGRLRSVVSSDGTTATRMLNDYRGRRLRRTDAGATTTVFVNPAYQITRAADGSLSLTSYLRDDAGPVAAVTSGHGAAIRYLRRDHKNSITHLFDADGSLAGVIGYGGYGEAAILRGAPEPGGPGYEGRFWNEPAGLYCFGARYYDPASGRFLTPDSMPGGPSLLQAGVLNRYAFELNNPVLYVDPSGHMPGWAWGLIIGVSVLALGVVIVATGGLATPLLGAGLLATGVGVTASIIGGAAITAGLSATTYSAIHHDDSYSWKDFGIEVGIGAGIGAVAGAGFFVLGAATASMGAISGVATSAAGGFVLNGGLDVLGQLAINGLEGKSLSAGLLEAAVFGGVFGAIGGGLGYGAFRAFGGARPPAGDGILLENPSAEVANVGESDVADLRALQTDEGKETAPLLINDSEGSPRSRFRALRDWARVARPKLAKSETWARSAGALSGRPLAQAALGTYYFGTSFSHSTNPNEPWNWP